MNVKILYMTNCAITIHFCKEHELASAEWGGRFTNLQDAIDMASSGQTDQSPMNA